MTGNNNNSAQQVDAERAIDEHLTRLRETVDEFVFRDSVAFFAKNAMNFKK